MLDFEEDSCSPPLSPVLGYSKVIHGIGDVEDDEESDSNVLVFCFNCKGQPRVGSNDHNFSPEGMILRHQLTEGIEIVRRQREPAEEEDQNGNHVEDNEFDFDDFFPSTQMPPTAPTATSSPPPEEQQGANGRNLIMELFGRTLDLYDVSDSRHLLRFARKNIHLLQIMSNPKNDLWDSGDPSGPQSPWALRKQICVYFNTLVSESPHLRRQLWGSVEEVHHFFDSFKDAFGNFATGESWEDYYKSYCGDRCGNESTSPLYHLFHTMLDIRWFLLVIFGASSHIIGWIMEDLLALAWTMFMFKGDKADPCGLSKQPFNCWCVKELWTMMKLMCDELEINFWNHLKESLGTFMNCDNHAQSTRQKLHFPLWIVAHLSHLGQYKLSGICAPLNEKTEPPKYSGYSFVNNIAKEWATANENINELHLLLLQVSNFWGFDLELVQCLWNHWLPKLDKVIGGTGSLDCYSTVEKWRKLIKSLIDLRRIPTTSILSVANSDGVQYQDPFLYFLKLLVTHVAISSEKDWRKVKSNIGMKLVKSTVSNFGEMGLLRVATLYMTLAFSTKDTTSLCDRLKETLQYAKPTPGRQKTMLRASATTILLLLQSSKNISTQEIATSFMSSVTSLLAQAPLDSVKKENVMIYLELLDNLRNSSPSFSSTSLGRDSLISANLTMWLSSCGQNYLVRTFRVLNNLTAWIIAFKLEKPNIVSPEVEGLISRISERSIQFVQQSVILNANRVPSTDIEPLASLAADLTLFSQWKSQRKETVIRLFDHFALNERTSAEVSQFYVSRILKYEDLFEDVINDVKWCQTWVRLNALDCAIAEELSRKVLCSDFRSTSNVDMLEKFCKKAEEWSRGDVQNILQPLAVLAKAVGGGVIFKEENTIPLVEAIVRCSMHLLKCIDFEKVYSKGDPVCVGAQLVSHLIPPFSGISQWDKLPTHIILSLKPYLFDVFKSIVAYGHFSADQFLQRKTLDVLALALLRYLDDDIDDGHPGMEILIYIEDNGLQPVLHSFVASITKFSTSDPKLPPQFLKMMAFIRQKGLTSSVIQFLPGILFIFVNIATAPSSLSTICTQIVTYCCAFGLTPFKDSLIQAFDSSMEGYFAFKSKRFFDLGFALATCGRMQVKKFLRINLLPLYERHVRASERRRGSGTDRALREPLERLDHETTGFDMLAK